MSIAFRQSVHSIRVQFCCQLHSVEFRFKRLKFVSAYPESVCCFNFVRPQDCISFSLILLCFPLQCHCTHSVSFQSRPSRAGVWKPVFSILYRMFFAFSRYFQVLHFIFLLNLPFYANIQVCRLLSVRVLFRVSSLYRRISLSYQLRLSAHLRVLAYCCQPLPLYPTLTFLLSFPECLIFQRHDRFQRYKALSLPYLFGYKLVCTTSLTSVNHALLTDFLPLSLLLSVRFLFPPSACRSLTLQISAVVRANVL